jgi:uncharacterized protein
MLLSGDRNSEGDLMRVVVTGGTGPFGKALVPALASRDHETTVITRTPSRGGAFQMLPRVFVEAWGKGGEQKIGAADAVIHLAAPSFLEEAAAPQRQRGLRKARLLSLQDVVRAVKQAPTPPRVLLVASSVAYYGARPDPVDERAPAGEDFLAEMFAAVEAEVLALRSRTRVIPLRFGQLIAPGGALPTASSPSALPPPSSMPFSFIHVADAASLVVRAMTSSHDGPLNVVATSTTVAGLHRALALPPAATGLRKFLTRPAEVKPVPVLAGQAARSSYAQSLDFYPQYPSIDATIKACRR